MEKNNNPWLALSTYQESDEYRFFGRNEDTAKLFNMLKQNDCIVIYAASGDGKSSVINAGLCPLMRKSGYFPIKIAFDSKELRGEDLPLLENSNNIDFDKLIWDKIQSNIIEYKNKLIEERKLDTSFNIDFVKVENEDLLEDNLWYKLRTHVIQDSLGILDYIPVIIFDQFEEVLRCPWKSQFFAWLEKLLKDYPEYQKDDNSSAKSQHHHGLRKLFKLIFSMRYEYVGELDYWCSQKFFIPQMMQNRYFLKPISESQALEIIKSSEENDAITRRISESAEIIINSISANNKNNSDTDENIPAIILSLTCYVLYEEWSSNDKFSLDDVSLGNIIYDYYKSKLIVLSINDTTRRIIEGVLLSRNGSRLRIPLTDERLITIDNNLLIGSHESLLTAHIVKIEKINNVDYIELIHDKLAEAIFIKRDFETGFIKQENKRILIKKIFGVFLSLCLITFIIWLSYKSLTDSLEDSVDVAYIVEEPNIPDNDQKINSLDDLSNNFQNATKLSISNKLKSEYINVYFDYNVGYLESYGPIYAGNAESVVFPFDCHKLFPDKEDVVSLKFGYNTRKVIILYPYSISSIDMKNPMAEVLVPYVLYEDLLLNSSFKNVNLVKMGFLQTFFYRINYDIQSMRIRIFGYCMPSIIWYSLLIIFITGYLYFTNRKERDLDLIPNVKTIIFSIIIGVIIYFLMFIFIVIEIKWRGASIDGVLLTVITVSYIFLFAVLIFKWITTKIVGRSVSCDYSILYNSNITKDLAIYINNELMNKGIEESKINLSLNVFKNNVFDYNQAQDITKSAKHVIVILTKEQIETKTKDFEQLWKIVVNNPIKFWHPIIIGSPSLSTSAPKQLRKKYGYGNYFPSIFVQDGISNESLKTLLKDLKSKMTKRSKIGYCVYFVFILLWIILSSILL